MCVCECAETWTTAAPMLNKRADFAATFLSGRLVVAGGLSKYCYIYTCITSIYNARSGRTQRLQSLVWVIARWQRDTLTPGK